MDKKIIAMAIASSLAAPHMPSTPNFFRTPKGSTGNRYKPHQGSKERARRLKRKDNLK